MDVSEPRLPPPQIEEQAATPSPQRRSPTNPASPDAVPNHLPNLAVLYSDKFASIIDRTQCAHCQLHIAGQGVSRDYINKNT
jgi:hypothetical protein